jgi:hypothetical protein
VRCAACHATAVAGSAAPSVALGERAGAALLSSIALLAPASPAVLMLCRAACMVRRRVRARQLLHLVTSTNPAAGCCLAVVCAMPPNGCSYLRHCYRGQPA